MSETVRLRMTLTVEFDADPDGYGTSDPAEMAEIAARDFNEAPNEMLHLVHDQDSVWLVSVEPASAGKEQG